MFDFSKVVDRHGTWCTQWDYVADRFGTADLLPFTISDMDFATAPCIIEALNQRLMHGVFGYSRWKNDEFLAAIAHWFSTQHYTAIDTQTVVYGPSVIYMVSELIRQWSETGEGVVIHTPAYDAFYKAIEGNQRTVMPVALEKQADDWFCDMGKLEAVLAKPECKIMLLCSPQNPTGKVWTCDELEIMADLCERHGVRVISDEIHMDMVWGEQPHIPWSNVARGDWALLTSGSKSFNIPAFVAGPTTPAGLDIAIEQPETLGVDLLAADAAAAAEYPLPVVVFDFGTATTVTVVDADRRYRGGVILAGVKLSLHALFSGTAQLPDIALEAPGKVICSVTEDSLQAGAIYGAAAMADGLLDRMEEELGAPCTAVATGGLAGVITPYCRRDIRRDDSLLLRGLALIWRKNCGNR